MKKFKRAFLIVLDSVGIGELPDAKDYGDVGANTLGNLARAAGGAYLPNLEKMGLGNIEDIQGVAKVTCPTAYFTKSAEKSKGKDTITGHWEMMGLLIEKPFKVFTDTGFPQELIDELEEKTGHKFIGNVAASGTGILDDLGEEHCKTKAIILYTSADSVLQLAASEEVIPLEELYRVCEIAREITLKEEYKVARIIARPFIGNKKGEFKRTANRHDYALTPTGPTVLNALEELGQNVTAIGKISDIYAGQGITKSIKTKSNHDGMQQITTIAKDKDYQGMVFLNLVDFDAVYGHRRDAVGYKNALEEFDRDLEKLLPELTAEDLLIITADHGNDPTFRGTDHTREWVPVLAYSKAFEQPGQMNRLDSMADLGVTILDNFNEAHRPYTFKIGKSFLDQLN